MGYMEDGLCSVPTGNWKFILSLSKDRKSEIHDYFHFSLVLPPGSKYILPRLETQGFQRGQTMTDERLDLARILIIQEEWDGGIEDLIRTELGRETPYDLVTDLDQAKVLLEQSGHEYDLILADPFLSGDREGAEPQITSIIEYCAKKATKTRLMIISSTDAIEGDALEQLDQPNVLGIHGAPLDAEAHTEIAAAIDDVA